MTFPMIRGIFPHSPIFKVTGFLSEGGLGRVTPPLPESSGGTASVGEVSELPPVRKPGSTEESVPQPREVFGNATAGQKKAAGLIARQELAV